MAMKRRNFLKTAAIAGSIAMLPKLSFAGTATSKKMRRVVVIGGGFAGATAAKYIRKWGPDIEVVLIEKNQQFISCPQSNLVLSGYRSLQELTHDYHGLMHHDIKMVQAEVTAVDTEKQQVRLHDGVNIDYDRLIIAPGVDFIYDELPDLKTVEAQRLVPHAWKAGPQTQNLHDQLWAMRKGGTVIVTVPAMPFRCPPGPYERACQIASFLKKHNPTGKIILLDANGDIPAKKHLFKSSWQMYYPGMIEYIPRSSLDSVDVKKRSVETVFDNYTADVLNVIPPQKAGKVADLAGVNNIDGRWCQVSFVTYESTVKPNIHIIGDAIATTTMPKSGHMANAQAKVCAAAVVALLHEQEPVAEPVINNTCYSFIDDHLAGHISEVFRYNPAEKKMEKMPGYNISPKATTEEGHFADAWAHNIWSDTLS